MPEGAYRPTPDIQSTKLAALKLPLVVGSFADNPDIDVLRLAKEIVS
jgi:hypothetical protein